MDWNNAYLIPLYNALLIPVLIFGLGLVVDCLLYTSDAADD